eukprot:gene13574-18806_t
MSSAVVIESGGADRYQVGDDVWCTDKGRIAEVEAEMQAKRDARVAEQAARALAKKQEREEVRLAKQAIRDAERATRQVAKDAERVERAELA